MCVECALQASRWCAVGTDEGGENFYDDERDGARGWSDTDEGGADFCYDERDNARGWSGTDEGGEDFYDNDADLSDARW